MPKLTLTDIVAGYQLKEAYNANNDAIETAMENTLSRDGTTPNSMAADLDMDSNKITNLANGTASGDAVNYSQLQALAVGSGIDHGALDGLADDDHTQYHTDARGDARYSQLGHDHAGTYEPAFSKNTAFNKNFGTLVDTVCQGNDARLSDARTPLAHTHIAAEITDLSSYTGFDARYFTESEVTSLLSGKADTSHTHAKADITDFAHTHPWSEITSQPTTLSGTVNLTGDQTVAGVKTFSSAPRTHRAAADMKEWWRTDATADQGRWVWQVGATGTISLVGLNDAGAAGQNALDISRSGSNVLAVNQYANGVVTLATQQYNTGDATTGAVVRHRNGGFYDVGMNVNPVIDLTGGDLTLSSSHVGGLIRKWDTSARNLNIPASTDTDIPIGAWFEYHGWNPGVVTLVGGAGVTINWLTGAGVTTGNRSLAQGSAVKIWRVDAARWHISGVGIS